MMAVTITSQPPNKTWPCNKHKNEKHKINNFYIQTDATLIVCIIPQNLMLRNMEIMGH